MGGAVGVTSSVAVGGGGVDEGEAEGAARCCEVAEAVRRMVGEADGGCVSPLVAVAEPAGVVGLWQAFASRVRHNRLATSLLATSPRLALKKRGRVFPGRLDKRGIGW